MMELKNPEDYFPYIGHDLDPDFIWKSRYYKNMIGQLFAKGNIKNPDPDTIILDGMTGDAVFRSVKVKGIRRQKELAAKDMCAELVVPRHRTLYDYCVGQPVHNHLINPNVLIIAGNNLFVSKFDWFLRKYGAFMFLREDLVLKKKGLPKAFLSQKRYIDEVFPAYMKEQMFTGYGAKKAKMDVILYGEQEKNPVTKKRSGGRTKTGRLRNLSHIVFEKLKGITKESDTLLYVTPANVSFSKYPEAPYIVHPSRSKGILKGARYLLEQYFIFVGYPKYAYINASARLEVTVSYGKPEVLDAGNFSSMRDLLHYSGNLREKIGLLETIYPLTLLYRALDTDSDVALSELSDRIKKLFERYTELRVDTENVSDSHGNHLPPEEIAERAIRTINLNPNLYISGINERAFLSMKSGRIISSDPKLQNWYANNLRHLDHEHMASEEE